MIQLRLWKKLVGCNKLASLPLKVRRNSSDSIFSGSNTAYMEEMHHRWAADPASVHSSWQAYFKTGQFQSPGSQLAQPEGAKAQLSPETTEDVKVYALVQAYQRFGHMKAKLDPLGLCDFGAMRHYGGEKLYPGLDIKSFGWTQNDIESKTVVIGQSLGPLVTPPLINTLSKNGQISLKELWTKLNEIYSGSIGYEIGHIREHERYTWLLNHIETEQQPFSKEEIHEILDRLTYADHFENFLSVKYPAQKRFGLDGGETLIPCMKSLIDESARLGVDDVVIGMPHRGRLNVLANVVRKNMAQIFNEFSGLAEAGADQGSGDVKYHLGTSHDRVTVGGHHVHLSLMPNPSHLEAVNPLVLGKTRAKMFYKNDPHGDRTAALILHGDASFAGQGIVYECCSFSDLADYQTGGCIHLVMNNQIGFTTDTVKARSTPYCTDVAKSIGAPIFHVNGDDPEAVVRVARIAAKYRQKFHQDIVIDLVCYRKFGHNEGDEPMFTQPVMYKQIKKQKSTWQKFKEHVIEKGLVTEQQVLEISERVKQIYSDAFEAGKEFKLKEGEGWLDGAWEGFKARHMAVTIMPTCTRREDIKAIRKAVIDLPETLSIHPRIKKIWGEKAAMFDGERDYDWGTAEQLAFGTLIREGVHVRVSGEDVERGTFSHRHAVLHEQKNCDVHNHTEYRPLCNVEGAKAEFVISNSNLSEYGILGFELGYSMENPNALVI